MSMDCMIATALIQHVKRVILQLLLQKEGLEVTCGKDNWPINQAPSVPDPRSSQGDHAMAITQQDDHMIHTQQSGQKGLVNGKWMGQDVHHPQMDQVQEIELPAAPLEWDEKDSQAGGFLAPKIYLFYAVKSAKLLFLLVRCPAILEMPIWQFRHEDYLNSSTLHGWREWMAKHHRDKHPTITSPKKWSPYKMQQLNKGSNKQFWRVAGDDDIDLWL
ncbi:hypothetical protein EDB19DRAFT_1827585 [Suillus lakei]|nr:hypothetical protein EDB19DRAFT_1827585 [Suillus lakei]